MRSVSNRLESLEDRLDDMIDELAALRRRAAAAEAGSGAGNAPVPVSESGDEGMDG